MFEYGSVDFRFLVFDARTFRINLSDEAGFVDFLRRLERRLDLKCPPRPYSKQLVGSDMITHVWFFISESYSL
jgi:hypothetical protein